ncbi:molybdopterin oxidoreductase [Solwaraspora sp. WMMD1047]|uniref:molybdopterin oxidoreductase n=1 Tax=Solwaraspora sp. WMMD1047 TaxID=3016102 RepID=UPI002417C759|nr:molybdopterin oxidoreductase [Solwaraspora sp. WMMD1047]MDG4831226.1 molybdopterin oxidoreductase [Solwaraspora sp. WMMD1047]
MTSKPRFLQGVFPFEGKGIDTPVPLDTALTYTVPFGVTTQPVYFRGGNTAAELIYIVLVRDGSPMRYFPIGARGDVHVPLRVVEDLDGGTVLDLQVAAPAGVTGSVVVDVGLVEV